MRACAAHPHRCSPSSFVQLVCSFPALRWLQHHGEPRLQHLHLREVLQGWPRLQLLQTDWRPAAEPLAGAPQSQQREYVEEQAFCNEWRQVLQHRHVCALPAAAPRPAPARRWCVRTCCVRF